MEWMRDKKHRLFTALLAGTAAAVLTAGAAGGNLQGIRADMEREQQEIQPGNTRIIAWWGTMYPSFCFARPEPEAGTGKADSPEEVKLSFWLAKAIDW